MFESSVSTTTDLLAKLDLVFFLDFLFDIFAFHVPK